MRAVVLALLASAAPVAAARAAELRPFDDAALHAVQFVDADEGWAVGDDETWPAHLERDTGWRVLNAGVRGYGLDQMVLRAERLAPRFKPRVIVLAFIPDDIYRVGLSIRQAYHKPYFVPAGETIELRGVPVPRTPVSE